MSVVLARVYDDPGAGAGARVLVDGLWPRGVRRERLQLDDWLRAIAPSRELRTWYGHAPERFPEFRARYLAELEQAPRCGALAELVGRARSGPLVVLTSTRDLARSHAAVLAEVVTARLLAERDG